MRKLILILILIAFTITSFGQQIEFSILGVTNKKIKFDDTQYLDIGQKVTIVSVRSELNMMVYVLLVGESPVSISKSDIKKITLTDPITTFDVWQRVRLGSDLNDNLMTT